MASEPEGSSTQSSDSTSSANKASSEEKTTSTSSSADTTRTFERPRESAGMNSSDSSRTTGRAGGIGITMESNDSESAATNTSSQSTAVGRAVPAPNQSGTSTASTREQNRSAQNAGKQTRRPTRKARLRISRLDPWSVMKTSFLFSIAAAIITFVAVGILWIIIDQSGALNQLQESITALVGSTDGSGSVQLSDYINQWRVLGFTAVVCVINVVLTTALCTLLSFLYNLAANVIGGLEVTLAED